MKGTIVCCLAELVQTNYGEETWKEVLTASDLAPQRVFTSHENVDDSLVMQLITSVCQKLNITIEQAGDAFGNFWMNVYAPRMYAIFFQKNKDAMSFLLDMDNVHFYMTKTMKGSEPPRFKYEKLDGNRLVMQYLSKRGLYPIFIGLIKGVASYYKEKIEIEPQGENKFILHFVKA